MLIRREKMISCPHCETIFIDQYMDEFLSHPLSIEQKEYLQKRQLNDEKNKIKTSFIL